MCLSSGQILARRKQERYICAPFNSAYIYYIRISLICEQSYFLNYMIWRSNDDVTCWPILTKGTLVETVTVYKSYNIHHITCKHGSAKHNVIRFPIRTCDIQAHAEQNTFRAIDMKVCAVYDVGKTTKYAKSGWNRLAIRRILRQVIR